MSIELPILHEDNHLLVVNKPPGLLSQSDLGEDLDLLTVARQLLKKRDNKPGNVYLGLVHRLDRPVGGAMVLAKTSKAAGRLSAQFRERSTTKLYRGLIEGRPQEPEGTLTDLLIKDRKTRITRVVTPNQGGKLAELSYRVLTHYGNTTLVEIALKTGLPHQIRVQFSHLGHPIVGDRKYGAKTPPPFPVTRGTIALYAHVIGFSHPVRKGKLTAMAPPPSTHPWDSLNLPAPI